jgi:small subunit ribosomal protein S9
MSVQYYEGVGRRKQSIARVRVMNGSGRFIVNEKDAPAYFTRLGDMESILAPIKAAGQEPTVYDITVVVKGGLARALVKMDAEVSPAMRKGGFLTRDSRVKERKKPGLKRARKAPTYTKR